MRTTRRALLAAVFSLALAGCGSLGSFSPGSILDTAIGAAAGNPSDVAKVQSAQKVGEAFSSAAQEITPDQEYYIGRAVAATVLASYKPWNNQAATEYVNTLGRTLSLASSMPETFSGYHFLIMDSDEINAFAAPSGFILVSRGLLRCASSEDEVAAILAHEVSHVALKHGLGAISSARWTQAALELAKFAGENAGSSVLRDLTSSFGGVISDIVKTMVTSGYSQTQEKDADLTALKIMAAVGYDPQALARVLRTMKGRLKPGGKDFVKTHPDPEVRIGYITAALKGQPAPASAAAAQLAARKSRYQTALGGA
jgi:beta-barrel assembly-enhancing protease